MKTILGANIRDFQFHKSETYKTGRKTLYTSGMIWTDGNYNIIIRGNKFLLQCKEGKSRGIIEKNSPAYRKIKRMIGIWFKKYRTEQTVSGGTEYFRSRCIDGMHNVIISQLRGISFIPLKGSTLILAS